MSSLGTRPLKASCACSQYISVLLRLSPDIAGITVLAFASGAPDIFTELAAINGGASGPAASHACRSSCSAACPSRCVHVRHRHDLLAISLMREGRVLLDLLTCLTFLNRILDGDPALYPAKPRNHQRREASWLL